MALISTIADNFDDGTRAAIWTDLVSGTGVTTESGGVLNCTPPSNDATPSFAGYGSVNTFDFTGCRFFARVPGTVAQSSASLSQILLIFTDASNFIQWTLTNTGLLAVTTIATVTATQATVTYNAATHLWWALRESGGTTFWETSPNGLTWTTQFSMANPITITASKAQLKIFCTASIASPGVGRFDNFNLKPVFPARMALMGIGAPQ